MEKMIGLPPNTTELELLRLMLSSQKELIAMQNTQIATLTELSAMKDDQLATVIEVSANKDDLIAQQKTLIEYYENQFLLMRRRQFGVSSRVRKISAARSAGFAEGKTHERKRTSVTAS
jgi:sulfur transfer complex TusBCD TusB component (DsrH family)